MFCIFICNHLFIYLFGGVKSDSNYQEKKSSCISTILDRYKLFWWYSWFSGDLWQLSFGAFFPGCQKGWLRRVYVWELRGWGVLTVVASAAEGGRGEWHNVPKSVDGNSDMIWFYKYRDTLHDDTLTWSNGDYHCECFSDIRRIPVNMISRCCVMASERLCK